MAPVQSCLRARVANVTQLAYEGKHPGTQDMAAPTIHGGSPYLIPTVKSLEGVIDESKITGRQGTVESEAARCWEAVTRF